MAGNIFIISIKFFKKFWGQFMFLVKIPGPAEYIMVGSLFFVIVDLFSVISGVGFNVGKQELSCF